jgi:hypothetical protein
VSTVGQPYVPEQFAFADPAAVLKPADTRHEPPAVAPVVLPPVQPGLMPSTKRPNNDQATPDDPNI